MSTAQEQQGWPAGDDLDEPANYKGRSSNASKL
jgi:hypothetical protein